MSSREDRIETLARALCENDGGDFTYNCATAHRADATVAHDVLLPQITTAEQLGALPDDQWLIGKDPSGKPQFWRRGEMDWPGLYLTAFGPFTAWQP